MAKLNIYHLFAKKVVYALDVEEQKTKKTKKEEKEEGISGFNLYLLIQQLAVLIKAWY